MSTLFAGERPCIARIAETGTSTDQKFCRSCGLGLQKIAQSLTEQLPTTQDLTLQERKAKFEKLGVAALSVFGAGILIPILYSIFYKLMWTQGRVVAGLGLLALLLVLACGLVSVILFAKANELKETPANSPLPEPESVNAPEDTNELLPQATPTQPAFSVADRTTELLLDKQK